MVYVTIRHDHTNKRLTAPVDRLCRMAGFISQVRLSSPPPLVSRLSRVSSRISSPSSLVLRALHLSQLTRPIPPLSSPTGQIGATAGVLFVLAFLEFGWVYDLQSSSTS